jgi:hypothetical protein
MGLGASSSSPEPAYDARECGMSCERTRTYLENYSAHAITHDHLRKITG